MQWYWAILGEKMHPHTMLAVELASKTKSQETSSSNSSHLATSDEFQIHLFLHWTIMILNTCDASNAIVLSYFR